MNITTTKVLFHEYFSILFVNFSLKKKFIEIVCKLKRNGNVVQSIRLLFKHENFMIAQQRKIKFLFCLLCYSFRASQDSNSNDANNTVFLESNKNYM